MYSVKFILCGVLAFMLAGCNMPKPSIPGLWPSPASSQVQTERTTTEKALAVARYVSQKYQGSLMVSDATIGALNVLIVDDKTKKIERAMPLRSIWPGKKVNAAADLNGLVYTLHVFKPTSLFTQQDLDGALAELLSQSAQVFTDSDAKDFSFIEMGVASENLDVFAYHVPAEEFFAERDQGTKADWVTFVQDHQANVTAQLLFTVMPSSSSASPSPAPAPGS